MPLTTNVTILIPRTKAYCDFGIRMNDVGQGKAFGLWHMIDNFPTPVRQGYTKFNFFVDTSGDAFLDTGLQIGYKLFLFKLGRFSDPIANLFNTGFARIDMDVKQHIFSPGKESWAKKAELIPQMEEVIAILWE